MHFTRTTIVLLLSLGTWVAAEAAYASAAHGVEGIQQLTGNINQLVDSMKGFNGSPRDLMAITKGMHQIRGQLRDTHSKVKPMGNFTKEEEEQYRGHVLDLLGAWKSSINLAQEQALWVNRVPGGASTVKLILEPIYQEKNAFQQTLKGKTSDETFRIFAPHIENTDAIYNKVLAAYT